MRNIRTCPHRICVRIFNDVIGKICRKDVRIILCGQVQIGGIQVTDNRLAALLKGGDEGVIYIIADRFSGYVMTVIRNLAGSALSPQDMEELCSDVFFKLWQHRDGLDVSLGLKPYLSVCARNAVKNRLRSLKAPAGDIDDIDIPSGLSVEHTAELHEMTEQLKNALAELSEGEREAFLRYFFYGEKTAQIAAAMGITEGTVRSKLSRTRAKLKDYLMQRGFDYV